MSLRGLSILKGGSHTWTLKGYQGFSSATAEPAASARTVHPPSTAKPIIFIESVMRFSPFLGRRLQSVGPPMFISSPPAAGIGAVASLSAAGRWTFPQVLLIVNSEIICQHYRKNR